MSISFEKKPLLLGLSGGVAINAAIVAMNTLPGKGLQRMGGVPLFTIGWILIIKSFLENGTRASKYRYALAGSSVGVYSMAMMARMMMDAGKTGAPLNVTKLVFMLCWIVVGVLIGMKQTETENESQESDEVHSGLIHGLGLLPPILVVLSMASINNMERPRSMASGPGMPMFMMAWVVLSLVNSFELPN